MLLASGHRAGLNLTCEHLASTAGRYWAPVDREKHKTPRMQPYRRTTNRSSTDPHAARQQSSSTAQTHATGVSLQEARSANAVPL
jgi:hypothetical protein